ncbi:MAG: DUF1829 domain-containing protein [Phycisphaerales bacterium]|nr:DUF1829 domain-containing protein [Phycisphaerales bacterium]
MMTEIQSLLDQYIHWLKDKTTLRQINDWVEITTPYLDRHNDALQLYAKGDRGGFLLTDDGYIIDDLEQSGCKLESPKRQQLLNITLNGFGVKLVDGRLEVRATADNFALRKHNLVQAMLAVNDLFYLAAPTVATLFYEDVTAWLDSCEVRYTERVKFTGTSGYDHLFDFVIPKSKKQPERIIQAINRPSRDTAQSLTFSWIDTKQVRSVNARAYAMLNDGEQAVSTSVMDALRSYDVTPVAWSRREAVREELAA